MKNGVVFALSEDNAREAVLKLEKNSLLKIQIWFGVDRGQGVITNDYSVLFEPDVLKENYEICDAKVYEKVYKGLYIFLDMVFRNGERPIYEYVNIFNIWVNYYYTLFKRNNIDIVIFGDNPHFGVDSIAKDVADGMGIKTVLFMQSLEANRFWAFTSVSDIGIFDTLQNNVNANLVLDKKFEKDLFYMKDLSGKTATKERFDFYKYMHWLRRLWKFKKKNKTDLYSKMLLKVYNVGYHKLRDLYRVKTYAVNTKNKFTSNVDLNKEYVYFPLHLQPEMTTSALGGKYCDQLLAIEKLSQLIPDDWNIYVKENPKQTYYMRESEFFRRASLIPKTVLIGREYNTYDLIRNSRFVATIAGTAGWEAISGGKNVLVFGLAWYRKLPGAFEYNNEIKLDEILSYKISSDKVEIEYNLLISKAFEGVLACGNEVIVDGYTHVDNNKYLYEAFKKILSQI